MSGEGGAQLTRVHRIDAQRPICTITRRAFEEKMLDCAHGITHVLREGIDGR